MKITTFKERKCFHCKERLKSEGCLVFIINPENLSKSEFDVFYTCAKSAEEAAC